MAIFLARMVDGEPQFTEVESYAAVPGEATERLQAATNVNGELYELYVMPDVPIEIYTTVWERFTQSADLSSMDRRELLTRASELATEASLKAQRAGMDTEQAHNIVQPLLKIAEKSDWPAGQLRMAIAYVTQKIDRAIQSFQPVE